MFPIKGKWKTFLLRRFSKLYSNKKSLEDEFDEDTNVDPDNIIRSVPLVALYAGQTEMLSTIHHAASQLQTSDMILAVVLASCRILEQYIVSERTDKVSETSCPQLERVVEDLKSPGRIYPNSLDRPIAGFLKDVLDSSRLTVDEATKKFGVA